MSDERADIATRFTPGNPGSGRAKHKGERDRISAAFLKAFADDFATHGVQAISDLREKDVASYVKVAVALQPKEVEHRHVLEGVDDNQIASMIEELQTVVAARAARVIQ